jgi:hypothetical protein
MEIDKQFQKFNQTCVLFENAIKKDIYNIVNLLKIQFDICERGSNVIVSNEKLIKEIQNMFEFTQPKLCSGVTKTGSRCTRRIITGSEYCKAHLYKQYTYQQKSLRKSNEYLSQNVNTKLYVMTNYNDKHGENIEGIVKILIDGSFYYADSSFIYDMDSFDKVGYVEGEKHVLSDDPFVLQ